MRNSSSGEICHNVIVRKQVNREVMDVIEKLKKQEEGEASSVDEKEVNAETESEENSEITDAEDVEQPRKRAKLDSEAVVSAT